MEPSKGTQDGVGNKDGRHRFSPDCSLTCEAAAASAVWLRLLGESLLEEG